MLLKIYQYIRGYVRIRITGHRMERFINACNYRKIKIWDLSASDGSYEMNLWVKDFKKLRHISHKTSTKIMIVKKIMDFLFICLTIEDASFSLPAYLLPPFCY